MDLGSQRAVQDPANALFGALVTVLFIGLAFAAPTHVYFAGHGGRKIGAHIVDTDAPGTEAETVASPT